MLQWEHSAILLTSIKQPFSIKTLVLSILKWSLKTGFTVYSTFKSPFNYLMRFVKYCDIKNSVDLHTLGNGLSYI